MVIQDTLEMKSTNTTDAPATERKCWPLKELPPHFRKRYRRLALVTHEEHLKTLDPNDEETLVVSCDWLLWQKALSDGRHCVHYELGLLGWDEPEAAGVDLLIRANDWVYDDDGLDVTVFQGVSLGKLFASELNKCLMNYFRLSRALKGIAQRFHPEEVVFYDFANDIDVLDQNLRREIVQRVADDLGLRFTDGGDNSNLGVLRISEQSTAPAKHGAVKRALVNLYARLLEAITRLRCAIYGRDRRVLILVNSNICEPLISNFEGGGLRPVFLARTVPRKWNVLWHCLRTGVLLAMRREVALSRKDDESLIAIHAAIKEAWNRAVAADERFVRSYVQKRILDLGKLREQAAEVLSAKNLVRRYNPRRLVVDGVQVSSQRVYIELMRTRGAEVDYIWHSPYSPIYLKPDALVGDNRSPPLVTRCLSWGRLNDCWLDGVGAKQPRIRVGSPIGDRYRGNGAGRNPDIRGASADRGNFLVLQYGPQVTDLKGLNSNIYEHFVDCVRALPELGYPNIIMKLHPGQGRWKESYFEEIREFYGLECKVMKFEPYAKCLEWADVVAGPLMTGALFETLAAGKPYYAFLMPPHGMDLDYYRYPHVSSVDEFIDALKRNAPGDAALALEDTYSNDQFKNSSKCFWEVLNGDFA
jgi:hypothetical protein